MITFFLALKTIQALFFKGRFLPLGIITITISFNLLLFLFSLDTTLKQHMMQATTKKSHFQPIVGGLFFLILTFSGPNSELRM